MGGITKTEEDLILAHFEDLIKHCSRFESKIDQRMIRKAFKFANEAHKGTRRRSGEPYILHPIAVAKIVTYEMGLGTKSVVCALLHDVVEDTDYSIEDIENQFGKNN
jgi:GTP pyrophosphokinase